MYQTFGYDSQFLKSFLLTDRDPSEIHFLLQYIADWEIEDKEAKLDFLHSASIYYLERFAALGHFQEFFELFELSFDFFSKEFQQETLGQVFAHLLTYIF